VLVAVFVHEFQSLDTELGFQGARRVVDASVYNSTVVTALMGRWKNIEHNNDTQLKILTKDRP